eukprot:3751486-Amphidinium_carterae.1
MIVYIGSVYTKTYVSYVRFLQIQSSSGSHAACVIYILLNLDVSILRSVCSSVAIANLSYCWATQRLTEKKSPVVSLA